jgi:DNA-binding NtrC family response regulator
MRVLLLDDEEALRLSLADDMREAGHKVFDFSSPRAGLDFLNRTGDLDAIVTDWKMPEMNGLDFLRQARQAAPDVQVIIMTGYATVQMAVQAMKLGAYDYLTKPFETDELMLTLERLASYRTVVQENRRLLARIEEKSSLHRLLGSSPAMLRLFEQLTGIAPSSSTVLITGETGTGKELVAEAIHNASPRRDRPLVKLSCATLPRDVLESELFGHEKGAFTGALKDRIGRFELAQGGTLYIDDVDDIPLASQVKLLRVLENRVVERVGSAVPIALDVRIVASTKADLRGKVAEKEFREDLFYRLNVVPIQLPPLRQRIEDIPLLAFHFLQHYAAPRKVGISAAAMDALLAYPWPGNVRELRHLMERLALTVAGDEIDYVNLPREVVCSYDAEVGQHLGQKSLDEITDDLAKQVIRLALANTGGNKAKAAELLRVPPSTLRSKMEKYGLL